MGEYLSSIDGADRAALERVYAVAREVVAEAEEGTSYGMAALLYRGKGLIATTRNKSFLSLYPYSGAVIASLSEALSDFDTTSLSKGRMPRRTGQNQHIGSPGSPTGIGKSPCRYAASRVPGSRSAPIATRSSSGS